MFKHIMVPLDGTERAERALPVAAKIARASTAQVGPHASEMPSEADGVWSALF